MRVVRQMFLLLVGVLVFGGSLSAKVYSCKMEELLDRTSLKYNIYIEDSGVQGIDNFLQLYNSKQNVYNKIYNYILSRKDKKTLLSCNNDNECDLKARALAIYATFTVTLSEKWDNKWFMVAQSAYGAGDMLWSETKNAYKISANTFLAPYKDVLDYLINYTDYGVQVGLSTIAQKDKNSIGKLLQNLIPSYSKFIKDPSDSGNISIIADDVSKILAILQANGLKNLSTLVKDTASLKSELEYIELYNEAITKFEEGKSCVKKDFFTHRELNYLLDIPEFDTQKILLNVTDIVKDIADILKLDKLSGQIELLSSMYKGVSFVSASKRTELGNILTFGGLVNNKLKYTNDDLSKLIKQVNGIDIYKFLNAIMHKKTAYIDTFLANYNHNLNYFKNYYTNEVVNPQQNYLISIALKSTLFNYADPEQDIEYYIENKRYTYVDSDEKYFTNSIPLNATLYSSKGYENKLFKISIWGQNDKTQNLNIYSNGLIDSSQFLFKKTDAFHIPDTNIYYYKYMIYDKNANPVYTFASNGSLRGDKFTYQNGKIYINGNYGVMFFKFDKKRALFKRIVYKYYYPNFNYYVMNKYFNIAGLLKNISIVEFKNLNKIFDSYILDKKSMNINAFKEISNLNDKLNTMSNDSSYIPLWYAYAYFYSLDRILHNKSINEKVIQEVLKDNPKYISLVRKHIPDIINQQIGYLRIHSTLKAFNNLMKDVK